MKRKYSVIVGLAVGIFVTLIVSCVAKSPLLLLTGVLWAAGAACLIEREQMFGRHREKVISGYLNDILERKSLELPSAVEDTLEGKLISQMEKLQDLLQYYDQRLWEEQESIKKLITEIAHQLRTPLTNIETYLNFCRQEATGEGFITYLEAIQISEERLAFLVENFIKISRLEHYCIQIKKEEQDIRETILQAMVAVTQKADTRHIMLKLLTTEPIKVLHDKNWLEEAVENLLDNSIKYSYEGSVVEISFQNNDMFTCIQVRDYGIGIEKGEETQIFTRFYRGKRVTVQEGFGIGLYLAREIVLCHDGFMKVTRKEKGLLAEIYLPV